MYSIPLNHETLAHFMVAGLIAAMSIFSSSTECYIVTELTKGR